MRPKTDRRGAPKDSVQGGGELEVSRVVGSSPIDSTTSTGTGSMRRPPRSLIVPIALGMLAGCSSGQYGTNNTPSPPPAAQANDIRIVQGASTRTTGAFDPNPKTVSLDGAATAPVRWVNHDAGSGTYGVDVTHRIVSDDGTSFDTGNIAANAAVSRDLPKGSHAFHCTLHPGMKGQVDVID